MAVVGPAQLNTTTENIEYDMTGSDVDAEGEDDPELEYPITDVPASEPIDAMEESDSAAEGDEVGADDEDEEEDNSENEDEAVGAVKIPNGREVESDDDAMVEDGLEESSAADEDDSEKNSSDAESAAAEDWEGGSEGPENAEAEVATRNNCM